MAALSGCGGSDESAAMAPPAHDSSRSGTGDLAGAGAGTAALERSEPYAVNDGAVSLLDSSETRPDQHRRHLDDVRPDTRQANPGLAGAGLPRQLLGVSTFSAGANPFTPSREDEVLASLPAGVVHVTLPVRQRRPHASTSPCRSRSSTSNRKKDRRLAVSRLRRATLARGATAPRSSGGAGAAGYDLAEPARLRPSAQRCGVCPEDAPR